MAQRLGFFDQSAWGSQLNNNSDDLVVVETSVEQLQRQVAQQQQELVQLRAMLMGVVEVLHKKSPFDDTELATATRDAYATLVASRAAGATTTCVKCQRSVPIATTTVTERGNVCDSCI